MADDIKNISVGHHFLTWVNCPIEIDFRWTNFIPNYKILNFFNIIPELSYFRNSKLALPNHCR